jgi:hypothetical protein
VSIIAFIPGINDSHPSRPNRFVVLYLRGGRREGGGEKEKEKEKEDGGREEEKDKGTKEEGERRGVTR